MSDVVASFRSSVGGALLLRPQSARHRRVALVTDRYVDILTTGRRPPLPATPPSPPPSPPAPQTPLLELSASSWDVCEDCRSSPPSLATLELDALECVLSWLSPIDLASVALVSRCMPIEQAVARRAQRLDMMLAPFRGLAQIHFLHAKESAMAAAQRREQERKRYLDQAYWGRVVDHIFHDGSATPEAVAAAEVTTPALANDNEVFVYNAQYHAWMPASADPQAWAAQNLGIAPQPE